MADRKGGELHADAILTTLSELDKWRRKQTALREEMEKVNRQVAYYESLVRDMKREVKPPRVADLLKALFQF